MTEFVNEFSKELWISTYKDHKDQIVDDTFRRNAKFIASAETSPEKQKEWEDKFYDLLCNFNCTIGGRIYSNAGAEWKGTSLHNCFISKRPDYDIDSLDNIMDILKAQALTLKSEGGWGENFSWIRPRGSFILGIGVESPGAVKYMELFDKTSDIITSGSGKLSKNNKAKGKIRKGALMGILDIWHPDILEFITAKQVEGRLSKFNISVNCTDKFMSKLIAVLGGSDKNDAWDLIFPETSHPQYKTDWDGNIAHWQDKGYPVKTYETVKITELWNTITKSTYNRNDPGIIFLDRAQELNPFGYGDWIVASNPCGEQLMASGNVCDLGSLNLVNMLNVDHSDFDYKKIHKYTQYLVRFLDNVDELSNALPEYEYSMRHKRRIGCGVIGWASSLYLMGIKFGSKQASDLKQKLMSTYARWCYEASIDLAIEKGMFPLCIPEKHAEGKFVKRLGLSEDYKTKLKTTGIRNSSLLSIQPTGNTSIFANIVSSGIEPIFAQEYIRTVIVTVPPDHIKNVCPKWNEGEFKETEFFKFAKEGTDQILRGVDQFGTVYKIDRNRGLTKEVLCEDYAVHYLKSQNKWDPKAEWAVTAMSLSVDEHLQDLAEFSYWVDSSISKTINCPKDYPFEDFQNVYLNSYKTGYIKGITTYREGTMTSVLSVKSDKVKTEQSFTQHHAPKRPKQLPCELHHVSVKGDKWLIIIGLLENKPYEVFGGKADKIQLPSKLKTGFLIKKEKKQDVSIYDLSIGTSEDDNMLIKNVVDAFSCEEYATHTRLISLSLRHGIPVQYLVEQLQKDKNSTIFDFSKVIARVLKGFIQDGSTSGKCPECGQATLIYKEGCIGCVCGWSKC